MQRLASLLCVSAIACASCLYAETRLQHQGLTFHLDESSGRYGFAAGAGDIVLPDSSAGVLLGGEPVRFKRVNATSSTVSLEGGTPSGKHMSLKVTFSAHCADLEASVAEPGAELRFQTSGASPAYGLADHAVYRAKYEKAGGQWFTTDVTGFSDDAFLSGQGISRLVSNFVIYPKQQFAELLIDPTTKIVHTSAQQIVQGVKRAPAKVHLYYFFGDPHAIYAEYLRVRRAAGYKVEMPKYQAFGVGWEAFGALGWETNTNTVRDSVDRYLKDGYPLTWMVIGSGFWPAEPDTMHETTSFGYWDKTKYPDPKALIQHFRDEGLAVMLGLRITFIVGGPYSDEGVKHGYFLTENGQAKVYKGGWPKLPYYLLDAHNPAALDWYMGLVKKWQDYGINGWKEDFYGYGGYEDLRDDKVDPTNGRLFAQKQLIIERNGYLSSNGDLHRINDFNYNQQQDRGPVNALAFAYSGFPYVYPDIVGGTFGENHFSTNRTPKMEAYMMRNARWASLHASMGMGEPPWSFRKEVSDVMLASAQFHARIVPYLYSNARKANADGYPWTMTPLPIAFPSDANVHGRENSTTRGYEWLIGDAMLAAPLYGDDYLSATTRDIYLPEGRWMDYDTGKIYEGKQTLKDFEMPAKKTPVFIGGSGVTLEKINGETRICVYPIAKASTVQLTLPESEQVIAVKVPAIRSIATVKVTSSGAAVATRTDGHAITFVPRAGASYVLTGGE
ncbi:TIM-barrel domain-containing protein [Terriglobus albidus]|nr:TIM-barrel domain-containing protein [Terriglobus albidus]